MVKYITNNGEKIEIPNTLFDIIKKDLSGIVETEEKKELPLNKAEEDVMRVHFSNGEEFALSKDGYLMWTASDGVYLTKNYIQLTPDCIRHLVVNSREYRRRVF